MEGLVGVPSEWATDHSYKGKSVTIAWYSFSRRVQSCSLSSFRYFLGRRTSGTTPSWTPLFSSRPKYTPVCRTEGPECLLTHSLVWFVPGPLSERKLRARRSMVDRRTSGSDQERLGLEGVTYCSDSFWTPYH